MDSGYINLEKLTKDIILQGTRLYYGKARHIDLVSLKNCFNPTVSNVQKPSREVHSWNNKSARVVAKTVLIFMVFYKECWGRDFFGLDSFFYKTKLLTLKLYD